MTVSSTHYPLPGIPIPVFLLASLNEDLHGSLWQALFDYILAGKRAVCGVLRHHSVTPTCSSLLLCSDFCHTVITRRKVHDNNYSSWSVQLPLPLVGRNLPPKDDSNDRTMVSLTARKLARAVVLHVPRQAHDHGHGHGHGEELDAVALAELCDSGSEGDIDSLMGLRIGAIFIILVTGLSGALFPILARRSRLSKFIPEPVFE